MLTRKQSRELQQRKQIQTKQLTLQPSSLILQLIDLGNKFQKATYLQEIFLDPQTQRTEDYNNCYNNEFLDSLLNDQIDISNFLLNHQIREQVRGKMVDWMIQVFTANQSINDNSFFRAINLMDAFLKNTQNYTDYDLYLIGVTCIFIASKIEDIQSFGIKTIIEVLSHNKFSSFQIKEFESLILETLNYNTNFPTINDCLQYLNYQLFGQFYINSKSVQNIQNTSNYILKMCYHDYQLMQQNQMLLAASILGYTIQDYIENHLQKNIVEKIKIQLLQAQNNLIRIGKLDLNDYLNCLSKVEELIQNFQIKYPSCENLLKFFNDNIYKFVIN